MDKLSDSKISKHPWCMPRVYQSGCPVQQIGLQNPFDKPDVRTYSQDEIWSAGRLPSWDSPDIWTYLWGSSDPRRIWPDSIIRGRVHNHSALGSALGVIVHCDISEYGLGTHRSRLFSQVVNIQPSGSVELEFPVPDAVIQSNEFFGAHISAELSGDINQINNYGSQVIGGSPSTHGREKEVLFPVVNRRNRDVDLTIEALPNNLSAVVEPPSVTLAAGSSVQGRMTLSVPDDIHGSPSRIEWLQVTVVAKEGDRLMDGMSYNVAVDD